MPQNYTINVFIDSNHVAVYPDSICVHPGDLIKWQITPPNSIRWIRIATAGHVFTPTLPSGSWDGSFVTVRNVSRTVEWKYTVLYPGGSLDPKIVVKPRVHTPLIIEFTLLAAIVVATFINSIRLYRIKKVLKQIQHHIFNN